MITVPMRDILIEHLDGVVLVLAVAKPGEGPAMGRRRQTVAARRALHCGQLRQRRKIVAAAAAAAATAAAAAAAFSTAGSARLHFCWPPEREGRRRDQID